MARPNKLIQLYLTNICNSRCKTCSIWKNRVCEELNVNKVIEIIKEYPDADYVFGGGEFTLYTQKNELLKYCDGHNINYTILTNMVAPSMLYDILENFNVKNLTISCDGIYHDNIRGREGNLKYIKSFVSQYKDKIPNIKISYTLSKFNEEYIEEDMHMFKSMGFDKVYFCIAQNMDLLKSEGDIKPSYSSIKFIYKKYSDMLYDKDIQLLQDILYSDCMMKCDSTGNVHTIYSNGDIVTCQSYLCNRLLGNIYVDDFKSVIDKFNGIDKCEYNEKCILVCQRRYDYEDRI